VFNYNNSLVKIVLVKIRDSKAGEMGKDFGSATILTATNI